MHATFIKLLVHTQSMDSSQRVELLQKLIGQIREGEYPYVERPKKPINWSNYDTAQCRQIVDVINTIRQSVDEAAIRIATVRSEAPPGPGRPPNHPADIAKVLLLQSFFGVPNRPAEGLLILFSDRLGIRSDFSYKTIERGYDHNAVNEILDEVFSLTNEQVQDLETAFSVDGSGASTSNKQNYAVDRRKQQTKNSGGPQNGDWAKNIGCDPRDYQYHLAAIGIRCKLFAAYTSTSNHHVGELGLYPTTLEAAVRNQPNAETILGDGLFAGRPACNLAHEHGLKPFFLPRRNATLRSKGSPSWIQMNMNLLRNPQQWLSTYHMRSISETGFSMLVRAFPQPLRKRLESRKVTEDFLRGICHNIKRLCYLRYLEDLHIDFRRGRVAG